MDLLYSHVSHKNPVLLTRYRDLICGHLQLVGPYKKNFCYNRTKRLYSLPSKLSNNNFVPVPTYHTFSPSDILVMICFEVGTQLSAMNSSCCRKSVFHSHISLFHLARIWRPTFDFEHQLPPKTEEMVFQFQVKTYDFYF